MTGRRDAIAAGLLAAALLSGGQVVAQQSPPAAPRTQGFLPLPTAKLYADTCSGCHGDGRTAGRAPDILDQKLLVQRTDEQLHRTIRDGVPDAGMPAFKDMLTDAQIWQLAAHLRLEAGYQAFAPVFVENPAGKVIRSEKQAFRLDVVAEGLETPWGMAFLPDGRMLVTERPGRLRIIDKGRLLPPVTGLPEVFERQDAGLLDVTVHPDYRRNGWVYISYVEMAPGHTAPPRATANLPYSQRPPNPPNMTVVVRGRINARNQWVESQPVFRAPYALYTANGSHYGSRFAWDRQGKLLFSIGDRGDMANAQKLDNPLGKIHRVNDDGTPAADNPFVDTPGAWPTIWSLGHRNPEGLAWQPGTGALWESEHGPVGGDEINIVEKGKNYGWGVVSMGIQPGITARFREGMEPPIVHYTPTIAPAGIAFYAGDRYPGWRNSLFVTGLVGQQLRRLEVRGRDVIGQEVLFQQFGRVRAVSQGPDGYLYILLQSPTGAGTTINVIASTPGRVFRLTPVT